MSDRRNPEDPKERPVLDHLVDAAFSDVDGSGPSADPKLTVQGVMEDGLKRWGRFARKHGWPYRIELPPAQIAADQRLRAFFAELQSLSVPVQGAAGFLEGEWQGVPFSSFAAYCPDQTGALHGFRFVCTPLSRAYPELLFDFRLGVYPEQRRFLYPGYADYRTAEGPRPPSKFGKGKPGLLSKVPGLREAKEFVDGVLAAPPKLHTASEAYAAQVASRPYEPLVFKRDWMVRGHWLVMFEEEHIRAFGAPDETPGFLDALPAIKRLVDVPGEA